MAGLFKCIFLFAASCSGGTFKYISNSKVGHLLRPVMAIDLESRDQAFVWIANPANRAQPSPKSLSDPYDFTVGKNETSKMTFAYYFSSARLSVASQEVTDIQAPRCQIGIYQYTEEKNIIQHLSEQVQLKTSPWEPFMVYKIFKKIVWTFQFLKIYNVYLENLRPQNIRISMSGKTMFSMFFKSEEDSLLRGHYLSEHELMVDKSAYFRRVPEKLEGNPISPCPLFWGPEKCKADQKSRLNKLFKFDAYQEVVWSLGEILMALTGVVFPEDSSVRPKGKNYPKILNKLREAVGKTGDASLAAKHKAFTPDFFDLVGNMLVEIPAKRIALENILSHKWCVQMQQEEMKALLNAPRTSGIYKFVEPTPQKKSSIEAADRWLNEVYKQLLEVRYKPEHQRALPSFEKFAEESLSGKMQVLVEEMVLRFPKSWIAFNSKRGKGIQIEVLDEALKTIILTVSIRMTRFTRKFRVTTMKSRAFETDQIVENTPSSCNGFRSCLRIFPASETKKLEQQELQFIKTYNEKIISSLSLRGINLSLR